MSKDNEYLLCSVLDRVILDKQIATFLRTHHNGHTRLAQLLESVRADRTEEEYAEEVELRRLNHEQGIKAGLKDYNQRRWVQGEPPIDRQGNPISTPPIKPDDPQP
jgi:hypothetical protein